MFATALRFHFPARRVGGVVMCCVFSGVQPPPNPKSKISALRARVELALVLRESCLHGRALPRLLGRADAALHKRGRRRRRGGLTYDPAGRRLRLPAAAGMLDNAWRALLGGSTPASGCREAVGAVVEEWPDVRSGGRSRAPGWLWRWS